MLGIQTQSGAFLELSGATAAKLQRVSPFFNKDSLAMERTLPLTFRYSPLNARELGLPNHFYTRRIRKKIPVRLYDNNNFSYSGELIIEAADLDVNDITKSTISGFFVTGVSSFFQAVKDKKLKELTLGGLRSFVWTDNNPASANKGFWQHIHDTLTGTLEYSFAPVRNSKWAGSDEPGTPDWMNKLNNAGDIDYNENYNTLAPQVSLKYVLQCIFSEHGWRFDYSRMVEQQWETLFMPSFYAVTWQKIVQIAGAPYFETAPLPNITINLQDHVPPEDLITNFIIDLRNRYNWGFDFDSGKKVCTMFPLANLADGKKKDWTKFMSAKWRSDFAEEEKIFAFRNEIDSGDALSSGPDLSKAGNNKALDFKSLPAPAEQNFDQVFYCWKENQFYICAYNEDANTYYWNFYADNIYDYEPTGSNEDFTTAISTMPVYNTLYRTNGVTDYYGWFPLCEQEGNWQGKAGEFKPWKCRLLFHRGLVWEANPLGFKGQLQYPYLTSICFTPTQEEPDLAWSNVFKHEYEGKDKGIIAYWFKKTLKFLQQSEIQKGLLHLPRHELVNFSWSDVILLKNIPFTVLSIDDVIPYGNSVDAELRRIG